MLAAPEAVRSDLQVVFEGESIGDPYVVALEIANVGRASIPSDSFDKGRGVVFGLDAPILKVLTVEHEPASAPAPIISTDDDRWELKPELIARRELIQVSFLTGGPVSQVNLETNPLTDVSVQFRDRQAWLMQRTRRRNILVAIGLICLIALGGANIISTYLLRAANAKAAADRRSYAVLIGCHNLNTTFARVESSMQSAYSDIRVVRDSRGRPRSIYFGPSYKTQVAVAADSSLGLIDAYILANAAAEAYPKLPPLIINVIPAAIGSLERLPGEGIGPNENKDRQQISVALEKLRHRGAVLSPC